MFLSIERFRFLTRASLHRLARATVLRYRSRIFFDLINLSLGLA